MGIREDLRGVGISLADVMLPKKGIDMSKWAVIACDQFTSEREYWQKVCEHVGQSPSTLNMIFPECYLEDEDKAERIRGINSAMDRYLSDGIFDTYEDSFVLVERRNADGVKRLGLVVCLDLEDYSYEKGSRALIRASEGTIVDRIPPRKAIRKEAPLELPHIMVLINDRNRSIIEALYKKRDSLEKVYDFDLMMNSGSVRGWLVRKTEDLEIVSHGFGEILKSLNPDNRLLFVMGDGNHSFATAKSSWEDIKSSLSSEERNSHPARFCMVELENIYDEGLVFEPIHRVLFDVERDVFDDTLRSVCHDFSKKVTTDCKSAMLDVNVKDGKTRFATFKDGEFQTYCISCANAASAPAVIQAVIDDIVVAKGIGKVDYTHGVESTVSIAKKDNDLAVLMPDISKDGFFDSIEKGGAFPRKTFSIGKAEEKRFYIEARMIR